MGRCLQGLLIAVYGLTLSGTCLWAETANRGPGVVSSLDRFSGRVSLGERTARTARTQGPTVDYQVLSLAPGTTVTASPSPDATMSLLPLKARGGFVVYELRAGELTTIIDGQRQERHAGEFWVVRPGENIVLETESDGVVLQTIKIPGP
jgi:hypothetical protein